MVRAGRSRRRWNGGCGIVGNAGLTPNCSHIPHPDWDSPTGASGVANKGADSSAANKAIGGAGGGGYFGGGSGCGHSDFGHPDLGACGGGGGSSYADQTRTAYEFLEQGTTQWYLDYLNGITTAGDNGSVAISWPGPEVPPFVAHYHHDGATGHHRTDHHGGGDDHSRADNGLTDDRRSLPARPRAPCHRFARYRQQLAARRRLVGSRVSAGRGGAPTYAMTHLHEEPSPRNPGYTLKRNSITSPSMGW